MWIKICGITTPEAIEAAVAAGVDAVGFVLAPSPRQLSPVQAARLAQPVRGRLCCVAVTRHPTQELLDEVLAELHPDLWQSDLEDMSALRTPRGLARLPVLRPGRALPEPLPARVLYEGPVSGAGVACDWSAAQPIARRTELVLAGGLTAATVPAAIASVRPFGVDVSSGVEEQPGKKSAQKILEFAQAARGAFAARPGGRGSKEYRR
ncbi:MAG TPA: phosphoribosylanthranilate isomerase [Steroidobacteraceae bacterium]|nr:phosphoribosylanthranilate isomerase [Steroidobacteraceae bacterium]